MFNIVSPKRTLLALLERCHPIADKKSAVPMLANVLLTAEGKSLRVAATDLYLGMSGECEAEIASPGSIALPAKDLYERVKAMSDGPIQITANEAAHATIKSVGNARRYTVHGLLGADFPEMPKPTGDTLTIPVDTFAHLMARTHYSISTDETRAHVNSALFEWSGNLVRMVSTDGHRLSKQEVKVDRDAVATMLIPLKAIGELRRLMDHAKGEKAAEVLIRQSGSTAFFDVAGLRFSCKTVDAAFPPYQSVLPQLPGTAVNVRRIAFMDALKAVQIAASDRTGGVKLTLTPGKLRVTAETPDSGSAEDAIDVDHDGPETFVGMNAKYVLDVLGALDCEDVKATFRGELDPFVIEPAEEAVRYLGIVMGMRL